MGQNGQMCDFGSKIVILALLRVSPCEDRSVEIPHLAEKSAQKYHLGGSKLPNVRFWLKNCHFLPLSESLSARAEDFDLPNLA